MVAIENFNISRRHTQTYADNKDFLPGRPVFARGLAAASLAQAKGSNAFQA